MDSRHSNGSPEEEPGDPKERLTTALIQRHELIVEDVALHSSPETSPTGATNAEADETLDRAEFSALTDCLAHLERVRRAEATDESWNSELGSLVGRMSFADDSESDDAGAESLAGRHIGRFEIVRELGRGGLGMVLLANDPVLRRRVALKIPRPEAVVTPQLRKRFRREGQAAARLLHTHIVPVYEVGQIGPICFIAGAYVEGENLAQWLASRAAPCPARMAAGVVADLADAMHYAHSQQILHRDLKPSNILIERVLTSVDTSTQSNAEGAPAPPPHDHSINAKITDFGLAKVLDAVEDETRHGAVLGTPGYMSPEQAKGDLAQIGPASDVYALGAILFEMLSGRAPFVGNSEADTLLNLLSDEPATLRGVRSTPRDLEAICVRCLEKAPAARYPSGGALAADLRRYLCGEPTEARPLSIPKRLTRWARRRPAQAALALVSLVAILTIVAGAIIHTAQLDNALELAQGNAVQAETNQQAAEKFESQANEQLYAAQMRIADLAVHDGDANRARRLLAKYGPSARLSHLRGIEWHVLQSQVARIDNTGDDCATVILEHGKKVECARFLPGDQQILTGDETGRLRIWDLASKSVVYELAAHKACVNQIAFLPDGTHVATASCDTTVTIWKINAAGLDPVQTLKATNEILLLACSPDGSKIASFTMRADSSFGGDLGRLQVWDTETGQELFTGAARARSMEWTSDGTAIVMGGDLGIQCRELRDWGTVRTMTTKECRVSLHPRGELTALEYGVGMRHFDSNSGESSIRMHTLLQGLVGWEKNSELLAIVAPDSIVHVFDTKAGNQPVSFAQHHADRVTDLGFSGDGKYLITAGWDGRVCVTDLHRRLPLHPSVRHLYPGGFDGNIIGIDEDGQRVTIQTHRDITRLKVDCFQKSSKNAPMEFGDRTTSFPNSPGVISPRGMRLERDSQGGGIVRDLKTGETKPLAITLPENLASAFYFDELDAVAISFTDHILRVIDLRSSRGICAETFAVGKDWANTGDVATMSVDRRWTAMAHIPGGFRLVDNLTGEGRWLREDENITDSLACPQFSADGRRIAVVHNRRNVLIWDVVSGELLHTLQLNILTNGLAFSPDGRTLAIQTERELQFWHAETGQKMVAVAIPDGISAIRYSPDGRIFYCASGNPNRADIFHWVATDDSPADAVAASESVPIAPSKSSIELSP